MILTVGIKQKIFLDRNPPIFFYSSLSLRTAESSVPVHGTGKSSVPVHGTGKRLCALEKAPCTVKSSVHGRKLCALEKALCTAESSVHATIPEKGGKNFPKTKKNFKPSHSFRFRAG